MHVVAILPNTALRSRLSTIFLPSQVLGNEARTLLPLSPLHPAYNGLQIPTRGYLTELRRYHIVNVE